MRTRIIRIGNSQGVRIPKLLLEQTNLGEEVELQAEEDRIIIRPIAFPRMGWDEAFKRMAEEGEDQLVDKDAQLSQWDEEEWQW